MDAGAHEQACAHGDGLVAMRAAPPRVAQRLTILAFMAMVAPALALGIAGGLVRAGALDASSTVFARAGLMHAALMICGFLGTVIGIERAVALKRPFAFAAPLASAFGAMLALAGYPSAAALSFVAAALVFTAVNVLIVRRQPAAHTGLLLLAAAAYLVGNVSLARGATSASVFAWWFTFVVVTIAAERLEMTRLLRRRAGVQPALDAILVALVAGAALSASSPAAGGVLFGAALCALALWLGAFDVARRTLFTAGLSRYMAIALVSGYLWLALAGIAWSATALGFPARDAALHALGIGFILSMVMGHAPVILPAVTRIRLEFTPAFYLPLALLHASLLVRLLDERWRATGALLNGAAIVVFALTVFASAIGWRMRHPSPVVSVKS